MHVVIGGYGRVGRYLASMLEERGHSVAVIDRSEKAFAAPGSDIRGRRIAGEVFDRDTLVKAGIERADAYAAVTSGDNSNIVSARIARERFGVPCVVARIYDPRRAVIYKRFGIPTISSAPSFSGTSTSSSPLDHARTNRSPSRRISPVGPRTRVSAEPGTPRIARPPMAESFRASDSRRRQAPSGSSSRSPARKVCRAGPGASPAGSGGSAVSPANSSGYPSRSARRS